MATWALVGLTGVLVLITLFYAIQTQRVVVEMQRARAALVRPKLVPAIKLIAPENAFLRVMNVGVGPALGVEVEFSLEPSGERRAWSTPVLAPGEAHDFWPVERDGKGVFHIPAIVRDWPRFRLTGTYKDAPGETYPLDEELDIRELWERVYKAHQVIPHDWAEETANHLKHIGKQLEHLVTLEREKAAGATPAE